MAKISANRAGKISNNQQKENKKKKGKKEEKEEKKTKIVVSNPIVKTNLLLPGVRRPKFGTAEDFDWDLYEDGWNGVGLKANSRATAAARKLETDKSTGKCQAKIKIYSHEKYATSDYAKYFNKGNVYDDGIKDLVEGNIVKVKDVKLLTETDQKTGEETFTDELLVSTTTGGSAIINLAKENKFFDLFDMTKEEYKAKVFGTPEGRKDFISRGYLAKIEKHGRASLYDGYLLKAQEEFMEQIELGDKANQAYIAHITGYNNGGFICNVQGLRCFLPASQATANKVIDFESLVGKNIEVMIMRFIEGTGFIVSRKMYLNRVAPNKIKELRADWKANPERIYRATVTGTQDFGIFLEIDEFYTGLLHKMYVTEETARRIELTYSWNKSLQPDPELPPITPDPEAIPEGVIKPGDWFDVIIYNITDNNRIVFTNILDPNERNAVVEQRMKEKAEYDAKRAAEEKQAKAEANAIKLKESKAKSKETFKGESVSFEELKSKLTQKR